MTRTLNTRQRDAFDRTGILRLEGLFPAESVRRARDAVLRPLAQLGLWKDGAWHLDAVPRPQWPDTGLKTPKAIGNKHAELAALLDEPAMHAVVDALLDGHAADRAIHVRPQVLFTLPNADSWAVPHGWHVDGPRLASGQSHGVQLFTFLDTVAPCGGGTLVVAGSHRLLNEGRSIKMKEIRRLLCQHDYFRELFCETPARLNDRARLLAERAVVGDTALNVVELTGAAGDAYFVDLRALHAAAPNATAHPRMMLTHRFIRADLARELAQAYGWSGGG